MKMMLKETNVCSNNFWKKIKGIKMKISICGASLPPFDDKILKKSSRLFMKKIGFKYHTFGLVV